MSLAKTVTCSDCGVAHSTGAWAGRPAPAGSVTPRLERPDPYRRNVAGVVGHAAGLPWLAVGAPATLAFEADRAYLASGTDGGRHREVEPIEYADVDDIAVVESGPVTESIDTVVTLAAGNRQLSLLTRTFDAAALDALLHPVRIRVDAARRARQAAPPLVAPPPVTFAPPPVSFAPPAAPAYSIGAPPPSTPPASGAVNGRWALIGTGAVVVVAIIALIAWFAGGKKSTPASGPVDGGFADSSSHRTYGPPEDNPTGAPGARRDATPALITEPDGSQAHESCPTGYPIPGADGWASQAGRGTDATSCLFSRNVGIAYWQSGAPDSQPRRVVARGAVDCTLGGDRCQNGAFVMNCRVVAGQDWITCEGGSNAVVYLFGQ